jgi:hypothetical protein
VFEPMGWHKTTKIFLNKKHFHVEIIIMQSLIIVDSG